VLVTAGGPLVAEGGDADHPLKQFVWDVRYVDAPVLRFHDGDTDGTIDDTLYYTTDANMNVTALVDTDGTVVERYVYDAYGRVTFLAADWSLQENGDVDGIASNYANTVLFAGYRFDSETGLYHVRHRMYHATLGRWIQRDPIGYGDGMGLYAYVAANPLASRDPHGLQAAPPPPINPETLNTYTPEEIQGFRNKTKSPGFYGADAKGLTARTRHVLRALAICSQQKFARQTAEKMRNAFAALEVEDGLKMERIKRSHQESIDTYAEGSKSMAGMRAMQGLSKNIRVTPGGFRGGGLTDPKNRTMKLPADRGLPKVGDAKFPPRSTIPEKTWREGFGSKRPTGLMHLAAEVVAEMPHFMTGKRYLPPATRDAIARGIWRHVDMCCLQCFLGDK